MSSLDSWSPVPDDNFVPEVVHLVIEDVDGHTFTQQIPNSLVALNDYKKTLGPGYLIVDIY